MYVPVLIISFESNKLPDISSKTTIISFFHQSFMLKADLKA